MASAVPTCVPTHTAACTYPPPPHHNLIYRDVVSDRLFVVAGAAVGIAGTLVGDDCTADARCTYDNQGTCTGTAT